MCELAALATFFPLMLEELGRDRSRELTFVEGTKEDFFWVGEMKDGPEVKGQ